MHLHSEITSIVRAFVVQANSPVFFGGVLRTYKNPMGPTLLSDFLSFSQIRGAPYSIRFLDTV
jgi:hypothetical protein